MSCWPRGPHRNSQTTWAIAKTIGFSLHMDGKTLLPNTMPIQFIEHGKVRLASTYVLEPNRLVFIGRCTACCQSKRVKSYSATKSSFCSDDLSERCACGTKLVEAKKYLTEFKSYPMRWNPFPNTARVGRNLNLDRSGT